MLLVSLLLLCAACGANKDPKDDPRIQTEVENKVRDFLLKKQADCQKKLQDKAEARTDSILMERAQLLLQRDSLLVPPKPDKPSRPSLKPEKSGGVFQK